MNVDDRRHRLELIQRWQSRRDTVAVVFATRPQAEVGLAEGVRYLFEHFRELPQRPLERMDLLLIGTGLAPSVAVRLVSLLREYARELNVVLTGSVGRGETLAALAGDSVVLHPMATMTTIVPPSTGPPESGGEGIDSLVSRMLTDSLPDKSPYRALLEESDAAQVGDALHRLEWVRHQVQQLCDSRLTPPSDDERLRLFKALTRTVGRGNEPIARREARELPAMNVVLPTPVVESLSFDLHIAYEQLLALLRPTASAAPRALIESAYALHTLEPWSAEGDNEASWQRHFDAAVH